MEVEEFKSHIVNGVYRGPSTIVDVGGFKVLDIENIGFLKSLGTLERVEGSVMSYMTGLESLGNLEYVEGKIDIENTRIKTLGFLKYARELMCEDCDLLEDVGCLEKVKVLYMNPNVRGIHLVEFEELYGCGNSELEVGFEYKEFRDDVDSFLEDPEYKIPLFVNHRNLIIRHWVDEYLESGKKLWEYSR
jgi:hypothetical protein